MHLKIPLDLKKIKIWADIGVNPFDRNCLLDEKVKHEIVVTEDDAIDVYADPLSTKLLRIDNQNERATELLQSNGYNGSAFKKLAPRLDLCKIKTCVNDPYSRERQDLLAKASTAGRRFHATGGDFLN